MPVFRVVHNNTDHNRVVYSAGDYLESDDNLAAKFPDKFEPLAKDTGPAEIKKDIPAGQKLAVSQPAINTNITVDEADSDTPDLKDVTADPSWAELAEKNAVTVKHSTKTIAKGGGYFLFDGEKQVNQTGLSKKEVTAAIADYVK